MIGYNKHRDSTHNRLKWGIQKGSSLKQFYLSGLYCWWNEVICSKTTAATTIAIHGGCATGKIWRHISAQFACHNKPFFAVSLPGHSEDFGVAGMRIQDYARAMRNFINSEKDFCSCNLLGHSMGGLVCQELGDIKQVQRMALVGTPPAGAPLLNCSLGFSALKYLPAFLFGWPWKYYRNDFFKLYGNGLSPEAAGQLYQESVQESGWAALQMLCGLPRNVPEIHGDIGIFAATDDRVVPIALQQRMVDMYRSVKRKVQFHEIDGCHMSIFGPGQEKNHYRIIDFLYPTA